MKVTVNGQTLELEKPVNIEELLVLAKAEQPEYVTVQKNDEFIKREDFAITTVADGDNIEFLYFMGGGAAWD
ncbi:MAG: sulfur carrier protein ThiS [Selenomonadaceae bacterium]|nr:sulfur carrier protein ThiS [Selenomonadaceae bacterium]